MITASVVATSTITAWCCTFAVAVSEITAFVVATSTVAVSAIAASTVATSAIVSGIAASAVAVSTIVSGIAASTVAVSAIVSGIAASTVAVSRIAASAVAVSVQGYSLKAIFFSSITNPSTRFVNSLVYASVALSGALTAIGGGLSVGQLTCLLSYANQYTKPFNEISGVVTELQNALACAARIFELIEETPETDDKKDALVLANPEGNIELSHVNFSYTTEKRLIEDFNLNVKKGQRIAIVGPTGCGKTTIINLLMRFYDVNKGKIMVEGTDIRDITRESLRTSYGMVLQDTWLRSGTIRDNITMGREGFSDEQIIAAAKEAHSYSFIKKMPKGLDTYITEDGAGMSQGQKQLLCITRVMLDLPSMLILDEATSSIDTRTEQKIQNAFAKMMAGRTSFIVAHRLSTIQNADVILVMRDGHIIEQGNHETLLKQNGFYAKLYNSQFAS